MAAHAIGNTLHELYTVAVRTMRDEPRHYRVGYTVFDVGDDDVTGLRCSAIGKAASVRDTSSDIHSHDTFADVGIAIEDGQLPFRDATVPEPRYLFRFHSAGGDGLYVHVLVVAVLARELL